VTPRDGQNLQSRWAVCNRESDRMCGAEVLGVTKRRTECAERWGCV